jgi:hypothetical protein
MTGAGKGYLSSVLNPNWAQLSKVVFRSSKRIEPNTQYVTTWVAPFGLARLIAAVGTDGELTQESAGIELEYEIDAFGLLKNITLDGDEIDA